MSGMGAEPGLAFGSSQHRWVYDRQSNIGRLDKGLDAATNSGWAVVDMKPTEGRSSHWRNRTIWMRAMHGPEVGTLTEQ
jgi:hypothetical protein